MGGRKCIVIMETSDLAIPCQFCSILAQRALVMIMIIQSGLVIEDSFRTIICC